MTTISDERLTFTQAGEHGNCVISPENGQGPYFTLIGGGSDEEQNALAAKICDAVNALRAQGGVASLEASPAPVSELSNSAKDHMAEIDAAMRRGAEIGHMLVGGLAPVSDDWLRDTAMNVMLATEVEEATRILRAALAAKGGQ